MSSVDYRVSRRLADETAVTPALNRYQMTSADIVTIDGEDCRVEDGGFVGVRQAAEMLALSRSQFYKIAKSTLTQYQRNGSPYFNVSEIQNLAFARKKVSNSYIVPLANDRQAAQVFRAFRQGHKPIDVVVDLDLHPSTVESLWIQFHRMSGSAMINADEKQVIGDIFAGHFPVDWDAPLPDQLLRFETSVTRRAHEGASACDSCRKARATYCSGCAVEHFSFAGESKRRAVVNKKIAPPIFSLSEDDK